MMPSLGLAELNCEVKMRARRISSEMSSTRYLVRDSLSPKKLYFHAELIEPSRTLNVVGMRTRRPDGTYSTVLRGEDEWRAMMVHFSGRVDRIRGFFFDDPNGNENLRQLNAAIREKGLGLDEAVFSTPMGRWADDSDFHHVKIGTRRGSPGFYSEVEVYFYP